MASPITGERNSMGLAGLQETCGCLKPGGPVPGTARREGRGKRRTNRGWATWLSKASLGTSPAGQESSSYGLSHPMRCVGEASSNLVYAVRLPVTHCGVYRLTARYRRVGSSQWSWHNDSTPYAGAARHRDCHVVVSPGKASNLSLYEATP